MAYNKRRSDHAHQPVAPQAQVVANAVRDGRLAEVRQQEPNAKYPVYDPSDVTRIEREEWAFGNRSDRGLFYGRKNLSDLVAFTCASGLVGTENIVFLGCVDSEPGAVQNDGSAMPELGFAIRRVGVCTGTNTGPGKIFAGDTVYWDWPDTYKDARGKTMPCFTTRYNTTRFMFATKRMRHTCPASSVTTFIRVIVEKGYTEPMRVYSDAYAAAKAAGAVAPAMGNGWPTVASVLEEAAKEATMFDNMLENDMDPLQRIVRVFKDHFPTMTTFELHTKYNTDSADDIKAPGGVWQRLYKAIRGNAHVQSIEALLETVAPKPALGALIHDSPAPFAMMAFGIPWITTELQNLYNSRIMGTALCDSPAKEQLDLNMR